MRAGAPDPSTNLALRMTVVRFLADSVVTLLMLVVNVLVAIFSAFTRVHLRGGCSRMVETFRPVDTGNIYGAIVR